tara:strand:- start:167 stop:715 length:549 start_codon:yes stop_codon:yes gene_type:complete
MQQGNFKSTNIILIGMMGSWKSTVGKKIANMLNLKFIDTDDEIEECTGMEISEIFREYGEKRFRDMEVAFFTEKAKKFGQVFSTGGGVVLRLENRNILRDVGISFFLKASPKVLAKRIKNTNRRPLLDGTQSLENKLTDIWLERKKYYLDCANHIINTDYLNSDEVVDKIKYILEIEYSEKS